MNPLPVHKAGIAALCQRHYVKQLYAFGSAVKGDFNEGSDVDFIVDFAGVPEGSYVNNYFQLKEALQQLLKRPVDLVEGEGIQNPYFLEAVNKEKQLIYGK